MQGEDPNRRRKGKISNDEAVAGVASSPWTTLSPRSFRTDVRKLQSKFPGLRSRNGADWKTAAKSASDYLTDDPDARKLLEEGLAARNEAEKKSEADEVFGARMLRLLRLCKTVYLEDKLRKSGDTALIARFEKLKKLEAASPLQ